MSDEYGDTDYESTEDTSASYDDVSGDEGYEDAPSGDTDEYQPEYDDSGNPAPVPYDRFKESRSQLKEVRGQMDGYESRIQNLQEQLSRSSEWNQMAWQQLQQHKSTVQQPSYQEPDEYADPAEAKLKALQNEMTQMRQMQNTRHQKQEIAQHRREILSEIESARAKYPEMVELEIINHLATNPNVSVERLAKRSHENQLARFDSKLRKMGIKRPPRPLQRSRGNAAVRQDFGDDLDAAERAALADFGGVDF